MDKSTSRFPLRTDSQTKHVRLMGLNCLASVVRGRLFCAAPIPRGLGCLKGEVNIRANKGEMWELRAFRASSPALLRGVRPFKEQKTVFHDNISPGIDHTQFYVRLA